MAEHINPEMNKEAFNCAICGAFAKQIWSYAYGYEKRYAEINDGQKENWNNRRISFFKVYSL